MRWPEEVDKEMLLAEARRVLEIEGESVLALADFLGDDFVQVAKLILTSRGRLIVIGIGKSGLVGKKIASTLASTGTPAFYLHPSEALHGDMGVIVREDIVLAVSHGGETQEILDLLPSIRRLGVPLVALCGNRDSHLARECDYLLEAKIEKEACPLGLAPTASTTASLALGDALAMVLLKVRGLKAEDFARLHPAGRLGRRLLLRVEDVLALRRQNPVLPASSTVDEALLTMTSTRMGAVSIVDGEGKLKGIITDGDVRRSLARERENILKLKVEDIMTENPMVLEEGMLAVQALRLMEEREIGHLPIVNNRGKPLGLVNYQDLFQTGVI